jgi:uncharacterized protein (DUF1778 family)
MHAPKRKRGGQTKPESQKRSAHLPTHWTQDDLALVRTAADLEGRSLNSLVTGAALQAAQRALAKPKPPEPQTEDATAQPTRWQPPEHRRRP